MSSMIRCKKLSHEACENILALIGNGDVGVGGRLPTKSKLIKMFNVSWTTIHEAVRAFAALGVLEIRPGL